jgi:glycosyltransferase involved in cell wall biosynthesis
MKNASSVSFVLTAFNKAPFLPAVLDAVAKERAETGGEIIIVNDGSSDGSADILDRFASTEKNTVVIHQENRGVAAATNLGLDKAQCPYIRLIDGDDIIVRGSTAALLRALSATESDFAFGSCDAYKLRATQSDFSSIPQNVGIEVVDDPLAEMIRMQLFVVSSTLGRKEMYDRVLPLPEQYRTSQDVSLGFRVVRAAKLVRLNQVCCYMALAAEGRLSASKARMFQDCALIIRDFFGDWPSSYRASAVRRNAGRARHYARRHLPGSRLRCASLIIIQLLSCRLTTSFLPAWMGWIANTYSPATRNWKAYP